MDTTDPQMTSSGAGPLRATGPGRRALASAGLALCGLILLTGKVRAGQVLRIGYQKNGSLVILRRQATLEAALGPRGVNVTWVEFSAGPPILEAMNAGAIDFAAAGDTPPIFAQAAGVPFVYVGGQPIRGENEAIVVRTDGPVTSLADLKGRRVAYTRGSSAHNVVVKALANVGLTPGDITSVLLQPSDALAAFRSRRVDAWAIWDPFLAIAEQEAETRVLVQATAVAPSNSFFLARRLWAEGAPDQLRILLDTINNAADWARRHPDELAGLMSDVTGVPLAAQRVAAPRGVYAVQPMDDTIIRQQQDIADTFARLHIIPAPIDVRSAVLPRPDNL